LTQEITDLVTARPARRPIRRWIVATGTAIVIVATCIAGTTIALLDGLIGHDASTFALGCGNDRPVDPVGPMPPTAELAEDQVRIAAVITKVGQDLKVPPRGWVIATATALQESHLQNLPHLGTINDHDSIGVFQQRPSQGWGTPEQLADPAYQSRKFYEKLLNVPSWQTLELTVAAQRVQVSAFPNAYAKHEPLAAKVVDLLTGGAGRAAGAEFALRCAAGFDIAASGWTVPVQGPIVSGFRTADRPAHNGVDIGVPHGVPIRAAAAGVVIAALCNAYLDGARYSCDADGSPAVAGCGWYVDILHAGRVITRYCHMLSRPTVYVGQNVGAGEVIGLSGSSGNSSGPHLHFEVHLNSDGRPAGAVDPIIFMNQVGVPLVGSV
jgi:murein DD-endopeptidase MepM/ murein hydrolase activator NlpD